MSQPTPESDQLYDWYQHLYGEADEGWLSFFSVDRQAGENRTEWCRVSELDKAVEITRRLNLRGDVWNGVAIRSHRTAGRGGSDECGWVTALWADIDFQDEGHQANDRLPPDAEAATDIVRAFPLKPTALTHTGGGLQAWYWLDEVAPVDELGDLLEAFGATWDQVASDLGYHIDNVFDLARIMRPAGSFNRKLATPRPVTLSGARWDRRYGVSEIRDNCIDPPTPTIDRRHNDVPYIGPDRPGDEFSARHDGHELLTDEGFHSPKQLSNGDTYYWAAHRDRKREQHGAVVYADGHITIYSDTYCSRHPAVKIRHGYDPFGFYVAAKYDGDFATATKELRSKGYGAPPHQGFGERPAVQIKPSPPIGVDADTGEVEIQQYEPTDMVLPEDFWQARETLSHIRQAAHSRIRSADLVLHGTLARLSAYTPHVYELPALAGAAGSLNYFTIAVGPSGAGKSSGASIADELLVRPPKVEDKPLGSGEGLAENYMGTVTEENEKGKPTQVRRQVLHNVFVYGDEGQALTEMMNRKGATLPEALRRAWTGGALGQANATNERTRVIPAGNYRLGILIGFQPEIAAELMADAIAGTPQRFTFSWAGDPNIPGPESIPDWPGELEVPPIPATEAMAHGITRGGYRRVQLTVDDAIRTEVVADAVQRARGHAVGTALDSHQPLHLLKLGGLLAILEGRLHIDTEDWELAHLIWERSCRVRSHVEARVAEQRERQDHAKISFHARREGAAEAARSGAASDVVRVARLIARKAADNPEDEGFTQNMLRRFCASRDRYLLDPAISYAEAQDWLISTPLGRYEVGESRPS